MSSCKNYVYGPKEDTPPNKLSVGEFFLQRLGHFGDATAQVLDLDGTVRSQTYSEILHDSKIVAGLFRDHGLQTGDTVMAIYGNTLEYAAIFWGTLFVGATIAPVNPLYDADDLLHLLGNIRPQVVVCGAMEVVPVVQEALAKYGEKVKFMTLETVMKRLKEDPGVDDFYLGEVEDPNTHVATVLCTTGSSGKPKCVDVVHTTIVRQLSLNYIKSKDGGGGKQEVTVNIAGPFGVAGQLINLLALSQGQLCVLVPIERFEEKSFLTLLEKYKVNFMMLGPCQLLALCKCAHSGSFDLSHLKIVMVGGSPVSLAMKDLALKHLNIRITPAYGMTECPGVCTPAYGVTDRPGTVGKLATNAVAKICDVATGKAVGARVEGELCLKAPSMMKSYRNNLEATKEVFDEEGFFHTGDTGYYDESGYFYLVDRIKELIKYRNVHVPATDIEEVLVLHPKVLEAAVIGVYHEVDWEHATAIVVVKPGETVSEQELVKLVELALPEWKWLRGGVRFVDSIPKSLNGKIQKRALRAQFSAMPGKLSSPNQLAIS